MSEACVPLEDLSALLDGELPSAEAARVREHAGSCAACGATLARLSAASRLVRALPREQADAALAARVAAAAGRRRISPRAWSGLAAAAALLAFGVLFFQVRRNVGPAPAPAPALTMSPSPSRAGAESPREQAAASPDWARDERAAKAEATTGADPGPAPQAMVLDVAAGREAGFAAEPPGAKDAAPSPPPARAPGRLEGVAPGEPPLGEQERDLDRAREDRAEASGSVAQLAQDAAAAKSHDQPRANAIDDQELADALSTRSAAPSPAAPAPAAPAPATRAPGRQAATMGENEASALAAPPVACGRVRDAPESRPVALGPGVEPPRALTRSAWRPPRGQGPVSVRAIVEIDGTTSACEAIGARSEDVARAAMDAASRSTWSPARVGGRPHAAWVIIAFPE